MKGAMTRIVSAAALLLLLAPTAWAQPRVDQPTGLRSSRSGLGTEQVTDYIRSLSVANTEVEIETRGETRRLFNAHRIKIQADWRRGPNGTPVLRSATITPIGGRLHLGDEKINKLTINHKGEIKVDRKGIDVTITKVTRRRDGSLELHLGGLAGFFNGNIIIPKESAPSDITKWPPELHELVKSLMNPSGDSDTNHEARVNWNVSGQSDRFAFPIRGDSLTAASNFSVRGGAELRSDGTIRSVGDNTMNLEVVVGNQSFEHESGKFSADLRNGTRANFNGRYGIFVPGSGNNFSFEVDGALDYQIRGRNVRLNLPSGARIRSNGAAFDGDGRLTASIGPGGSTLAVKDGTYNMRLDGPIAVNGLRTEEFGLEDLEFDGTVTSSGTIEEMSPDRLAMAGRWDGDLVGIRGRILGREGSSARFLPGSNAKVTGEDVRINTRYSTPSNNLDRTNMGVAAKGKVEGEFKLGDVRYNDGRRSANLGQVDVDVELEGDLGSLGDPEGRVVRNLRGSVDAEVVEGGSVGVEGLPNALGPVDPPARPAPAPAPQPQPAQPAQPRISFAAGELPLRRGAEGREVEKLQELLRLNGYDVAVDGDFGPGTERAVRDFQSRKGLTVDGIAGSNTIARLQPSRPAARPQPQPQPQPQPSQPAAEPEDLGPGYARTKVDPGTRARIDLEDASVDRDGRIRARGLISSTLRLRDMDVRTGTLAAKVLGAAQATAANAGFNFDSGNGGLQLSDVKVPVRIDLSAGSRIYTTAGGMNVEIDKDGSYAEFTVVVENVNGKLRIGEFQQVDLLLHSDGAARFAGEVADVSGSKTIRYTGRMVMLPRGIDFFGDVSVTVRGTDDTPAVRIRW